MVSNSFFKLDDPFDSSKFNRKNNSFFDPNGTPNIESQIGSLESQLSSRGVDVPAMSTRSMLDRIIDAISVTTYPIMGALNNTLDNDPNTTAWKGVTEGLKASNPFGDGYQAGEKTFSDVLNTSGWEKQANPDGKWYNPLSWNANNVAHGITSFVGDVALDPATYATFGTGALLKGTGASAAKGTAKSIAREGFEAGIDKLGKGEAKNILERLGQESSKEMQDSLINQIKRTAGYEPKQGKGISWGIGDKRLTLVSDEAIRNSKLAQTVSPYFNAATEKLAETKFGKGVSNVFQSTQTREATKMSRENPEAFAKRIAFSMKTNDMYQDFAEIQQAFKDKSEKLFDGLSAKSQKIMTDLMEKKGVFEFDESKSLGTKTVMKKSEQAQKMIDDLVTARDEIASTVEAYKQKGVLNARVTELEDIVNRLNSTSALKPDNYENLVRDIDFDELKSLNMSGDELRTFLNNYIDKDVTEIEANLNKLEYLDPNINKEKLAYAIRGLHDKVQSTMTPAERRTYLGETMQRKVERFVDGRPMTDYDATKDFDMAKRAEDAKIVKEQVDIKRRELEGEQLKKELQMENSLQDYNRGESNFGIKETFNAEGDIALDAKRALTKQDELNINNTMADKQETDRFAGTLKPYEQASDYVKKLIDKKFEIQSKQGKTGIGLEHAIKQQIRISANWMKKNGKLKDVDKFVEDMYNKINEYEISNVLGAKANLERSAIGDLANTIRLNNDRTILLKKFGFEVSDRVSDEVIEKKILQELLKMDMPTLKKQAEKYKHNFNKVKPIEEDIVDNVAEEVKPTSDKTDMFEIEKSGDSFTVFDVEKDLYVDKNFKTLEDAEKYVDNEHNKRLTKQSDVKPMTVMGEYDEAIGEHLGKKGSKMDTPNADAYNELKKEIDTLKDKYWDETAIPKEMDRYEELKTEMSAIKDAAFEEMKMVREAADAKFAKNFGEEVPHSMFRTKNGLTIYEPVGSPQKAKVEMIIKAANKMDAHFEFGDKLSKFIPQTIVQLTDAETIAEAFTSRSNIIVTNRIKGTTTKEISNRVGHAMTHEEAHNIAMTMYDKLFKQIWEQTEHGPLLIKDSEWGALVREKGSLLPEYELNNNVIQEDFAEAFNLYINNPERLMKISPERFDMIRTKMKEFIVPDKKVAKNDNAINFKTPQKASDSSVNDLNSTKVKLEGAINKIAQKGTGKEESIKELDEITKKLVDEDIIKKEFERQSPTMAWAIEVEESISKKSVKMNDEYFEQNKRMFDSLADVDAEDIKSVLETVKNDYYKWGLLENIKDVDDTILTHITHMIRNKLTDGDLAKVEKSDNKFFGELKNVFNTERKWGDKTVSEVNKIIKEKSGKDDYFETVLSRIYLNRGLKHNQYVFSKRYGEELINNFGDYVTDVNKIPADKKLFAHTEDLVKLLGSKEFNTPDMEKTLESLKLPKELKASLGLLSDTEKHVFRPIVEIPADTFARLKGISNSFKTFVLPELIIEDMNKAGKLMADEHNNALLNVYDKFLQTFKVQATAVNPGFHVRNLMSNTFQNYLNVGYEAVNPENQYKAIKLMSADDDVLKNMFIKTKKGKEVSLLDIKTNMRKTGVLNIDKGRFANETDAIVNELGTDEQITKNLSKDKKSDINKYINPLSTVFDIKNPLKTLGKSPLERQHSNFFAYEWGKKGGEKVENFSKVVNYISNVKNGADFLEAADNTKKFLFDYSDLSDVEAKVFKRIVPFYTWMRKNIPLQLQMLVEKPSVYKAYGMAKQEIEKSVSEEDQVPNEYKNKFAQDWIQLPFNSKGKSGKDEPLFMNPSLPLADLNKVPLPTREFAESIFTSMAPFIKVPTEILANKNVYFNSPISRGIGDRSEAPGYLQAIMGGTDEKPATMSPEARYVLQNVSPFAENISKVLNTKQGGEEQALSGLKFAGGASMYSYDVEKFKKWALRDRLKVLKDISKNEE